MLLWIVSSALAAPCDTPVKPDQLAGFAEDALFAFATMDEDGFVTSADRARTEIACLDAPLMPPQAASIHRLEALRAFLDGNDAAALASFKAARRIEPDYRLSTKIAPEGGPLAELYAQAGKSKPGTAVGQSLPAGALMWVDGSSSGKRLADQPSVVQLIVGPEVAWSNLVDGSKSLPKEGISAAEAALATSKSEDLDDLDLDLDSEPVVDFADLDDPAPPTRGKEKPKKDPRPEPLPTKPRPESSSSVKPALGLGAGAVAAFAIAAGTRTQFDNNPSPGLYAATNGAHATSIVLGGAATALLVRHIVTK